MAMQTPSEDDVIAGAIADTEQEIFDEALGQPEDDNDGDTSLEEIDDDVPGEEEEGDDTEPDNPDDEASAASEEDESTQQEPEREEQLGPVPSARLRDETRRREAIEQELATARAQLAAYQVAQQQAQQRSQPQHEQPAEPDLFSDPVAWAANEREKNMREFTARHVNASLADAHEQHGDEFTAAYKTLTSLNRSDPIARATVQRVWDAPNPGKALMRWYGEQTILREAGGDPTAYRQKVAREIMSDPEFRKQILEDMRGEATRGDNGRPRTSTRLPKSLNGASGGGSVRASDPELYNNSEDSVFSYAMR